MRVLAEQNRSFGYAVAASAALHALLLLNLPAWRQSSPAASEAPLVAHLVEPAPRAPPAPPAPPEVRKPEPPKPAPPKRRARPAKPKAEATPLAKAGPRATIPPPPPAPAPPEESAMEEAPEAAPPAPPPPSAAPPAAAATARAAPDPAEALARFRDGVRDVAGRYKRYPRVALDNGWTGDVVVLIEMGASGKISSIKVKTGSGYEVLDAQALEMFGKAVPQVPVPEALRGRAFTLELRAVYNLRDRPG